MQLKIIPTKPAIAHQQIDVILSGVQYRISLRWNGRISTWMADIHNADGLVIVLSHPLHIGIDILGQTHYMPECPPGALGLISDIPNAEPSYNNMSTVVKLAYLDIS
jgi:hypothetical protein